MKVFNFRAIKPLTGPRGPCANLTARPKARLHALANNDAYGSWDYDVSCSLVNLFLEIFVTPGSSLPASQQRGCPVQSSSTEEFGLQGAHEELLQTAAGMLRHMRSCMTSAHHGCEPTPDELAAAVVRTAEANGALPPLSAAQRTGFQNVLAKVAQKLRVPHDAILLFEQGMSRASDVEKNAPRCI